MQSKKSSAVVFLNGQSEEVQMILDHRKQKGQMLYLIAWKNPNISPSWETADTCRSIKQMITKYLKQQKGGTKTKRGKAWFDAKDTQRKKMSAQQKKRLEQLKKGERLYTNYELERISVQIERLKQHQQTYDPEEIYDFLIDQMTSFVFNQQDQLFCIVKTIQDGTQYVVPYKKMKKHFPLTLRLYFQHLIKIHQDKSEKILSFQENEPVQQHRLFRNVSQRMDSQRFDESNEEM